jgi:hypothetical protein
VRPGRSQSSRMRPMWPSSATIPRRHPDPRANRNPLAPRGLARAILEIQPTRMPSARCCSGRGYRLLDPVAAWYVGNIPLGAPAENAVGGRIDFKTGTSYGDRGAWAIGKLPLPLQQFRSPGFGSLRSIGCGSCSHPMVSLWIMPLGQVPIRLCCGPPEVVEPLMVFVSGLALAETSRTRHWSWEPDGPGFVRLTVMDARGAADSSRRPRARPLRLPRGWGGRPTAASPATRFSLWSARFCGHGFA